MFRASAMPATDYTVPNKIQLQAEQPAANIIPNRKATIFMKNFIPDNVSKYDNVYDVLKERGFIEQVTDEDAVRKLLTNEKIKFYIGFDPTADCLHVGHFMQVIIMMYMQKFEIGRAHV